MVDTVACLYYFIVITALFLDKIINDYDLEAYVASFTFSKIL